MINKNNLELKCCKHTIYARRSYRQMFNDFGVFKFIHQKDLINYIITSNINWSSSEFQKLVNFLVFPRFMNGGSIRLRSKNVIDLLSNILVDIKNDNFDKNLNHFLIYYQIIFEEQVPWSLTDHKRFYSYPNKECHSIPVLAFELLFCSNNDNIELLIKFIEEEPNRLNKVKQLCQIIAQLLIRKFQCKNQMFGFQEGMLDIQWWSACTLSKRNCHLLRKFVCKLILVNF